MASAQPSKALKLMGLRPDAEARILRLLDFARNRGQHIGYADTARRETLLLRAMSALPAEQPHVERWAAAFAAMLQQIDIHVGSDDLLAGAFSPAPPDLAQWESARQTLSAGRNLPPCTFPPELSASLAEISSACSPGAWFGSVGQGHSNVNFELVLQRGMTSLADEADAAATQQTDLDRSATSRAMATALRGAMAFAERHAALAETMCAQCPSARTVELQRLASSCRRVPARPAESFFDALQSVWFTYLVLGMSESPSANSVGCADRYLFPFYHNDLATGRITMEEADELICHFLLKCACYAEGQALTLGGRLADGTDATNELSRRFFRLIPLLGLPEPIIAIRVHADMAESDLDSLVAITATGQGQPSYYHEERCRAMLATRQVTATDRERLAINSCMGVVVAGAEVSDMWGAVVPLCSCLEMAISRGTLADGRVLPGVAKLCRPDYRSLDELIAAFEQVTRWCTSTLVERNRLEKGHLAQWAPNPFLSALLDDSRARGLDRMAGGPRYASVIVEAFGWANVSDSLVAIDELVFRRGTVSLSTLLEAARNDYLGKEGLLHDLRACPKYGNDQPTADAMARRVLDLFITVVTSQRRPGEHAEYLPSLHTLNNNVDGGRWAPVSFDGRRHGAPLNKQQGPSEWAALRGPTAVLASAARIPTDLLTGGQALDISMPASLFADSAGRKRFKSLLNTYFSLGGADLQVNTCRIEDLRQAMTCPTDYGHLIVRVAGYSEYFIKLPRPSQQDLVNRMAVGL